MSTRATPAPAMVRARRLRRRRAVLHAVGILVLIVVVYFVVTLVQVVQASREDHAGPAGAIVVLGAAQYDGRPSDVLQARLDHTADLFSQGLAPIVVVTGGRRPGDRFSEAQAAANYLMIQGVPQAALRLEVDGANSWQSLAAVARFLKSEGIDDVLIVSSPYHALRTTHIASEVGLTGRSSPATKTPEGFVDQARHYLRETVAVGVGRIIGHRRLVDLDGRVGRVRGAEERD
ncbi:MAG TPA: YdcF family protein [Acidimicrobiales bacterium]|nr:YdcF family protein [Acidimicrobiales bacterium]